jgi:hypothetical protein
MKKTNEQIRKEIESYLDRTSKHLFVKPDGTHFKVFPAVGGFRVMENNIIKPIDLESLMKYYEGNSKSVLKHRLFLKKDMKSVRNVPKFDEIDSL